MALAAFRVNILSLSPLMYAVSFIIGKITLVYSMSVYNIRQLSFCTKICLLNRKYCLLSSVLTSHTETIVSYSMIGIKAEHILNLMLYLITKLCCKVKM